MSPLTVLMALTRPPVCLSEWSPASPSPPAGHRWHPHLDVSIQASWQRGFCPRLSAVSAKLQGSCFFCSSIFWLRQYCEKGEAGRWIRRATEGEEEKTKHLSAPPSTSQAWPRTHRKPLVQIRYKLVSSAQLTCFGRAVRRQSDADEL